MRQLFIRFCLLGAILTLGACNNEEQEQPTVQGEAILDAFYAYDQSALAAQTASASNQQLILYYQAWAEAAHYAVVLRKPCVRDELEVVCAVTVTDDFGTALGYQATDTFTFKFSAAGALQDIGLAADDPPIFMELFAWMETQHPEILRGPCDKMFAGGDTPGECARAVASAAKEFMAIRTP